MFSLINFSPTKNLSVSNGNENKSGDVLNDIGNMLQDLTDELDAMLELETQ